jgi:O-antigen ligase
VILLLAGEGLWQSRSAQPFWFYGQVPVIVPSGFETAIFGPYFNRNHFATVIAMGGALAAGLAASLSRARGGMRLPALSEVILLSGASSFLGVTTAASGSRSGTLAVLTAVAVVAARTRGKGFLLLTVGVGSIGLVVAGAFAVERLARLDVLQSRLAPWLDMAGLTRFFPVFGSGLGTFAVTYWPYQTNARYEFWQHAHNDYLQFIVEGGIAGLLALYLIARRLREGITLAPKAKEAALAAATAFGTQAFFDFPCRVPANAAVFVCLIALCVSSESSEQPPKKLPPGSGLFRWKRG